jgi:hypothetical protein
MTEAEQELHKLAEVACWEKGVEPTPENIEAALAWIINVVLPEVERRQGRE